MSAWLIYWASETPKPACVSVTVLIVKACNVCNVAKNQKSNPFIEPAGSNIRGTRKK